MTTVLVRTATLEAKRDRLREFLRTKGVKQFKYLNWLHDWLNDAAGSFWGRKCFVPKRGDVCVASIKPKKDGPGYYVYEKISRLKCEVDIKGQQEGDVKVRVVSRKGQRLECVLADSNETVSAPTEVVYKIYYTARGVTGELQCVSWHKGIARLEDVAPNEDLPISLLSGFERIDISSVPDRGFVIRPVTSVQSDEDDDGYALAVECSTCDGEGTVTCDCCDGSGRYEPTCKKCEGTGQVTCKRCGGSGESHGGECFACHGSGTYECRICHGTGQLNLTCNACKGKGEQECRVCHGTGVCFPRIDFETGSVTLFGRDREIIPVRAQDVFLWSESDGRRESLEGSWDLLEEAVRQALKKRERASNRSARLQKECELLLEGLQKKVNESKMVESSIVHARVSSVSPERKRGKVVYRLREVGKSEWTGSEPFQTGTSLQIANHEPPQNTPIEYGRYDKRQRELIVAFPQEMDMTMLRDVVLDIKSRPMPAPEKRQFEFLRRWMSTTDSPTYKAIVEGCPEGRVDGLKLFNKGIAKFEMQRKAVEIGASETPLFLLKGPPGTGKTTIIVEIIRQAIHQGKRVLLTSQTHQAVENVLEKLHNLSKSGEDRAIRMVHYTAQEGKASELAKAYSDGSGTEEVKSIRVRVSERIAKETEALAAVDRAVVKRLCETGAREAEDLVQVMERKKADLEKIERDLASDLKKCDEDGATSLAELDKTLGRQIAKDKETLASKRGELSQMEAKIKECDASISAGRKRKAKLQEDGIAGSIRRFVGRIRLVKMISDDYDIEKIDDKIARENRKRESAELERVRTAEEIQRKEADLKGEQVEYDSKKSEIEGRNDKAKDEKRKQHAKAKEARTKEAALAEKKIRQSQEERLSKLKEILDGFLNGDLGVEADSLADAWRALNDKVESEIARREKVVSFMSDWEKRISDKPEVIAQFLKSQTNVFLATCVGVGGWRSLLLDGAYARRFEEVEGIKREHVFDLVVVDEAGHATFAETIIPLSLGHRAILIGDDKQLPPMEDDELETYSLFTRLWEDKDCHVPKVMLDTQFRMHPEIANFVSDTFYEGKLKSGVTATARSFQFSSFTKPVCLISTSKQKNRFEKWIGTSCENRLEAQYVKEVVQELVQHCREHGEANESVSVAVITPYAAQVSLIKMLLREDGIFGASGSVALKEEDVASVDKFQGGERDVVIISFVRSPDPHAKYKSKLTFVQDLKRLNVAFSRPKKMLIMVGDIKTLSTGLGDEDGRKAFEAFHKTVRETGREILVWERGAK